MTMIAITQNTPVLVAIDIAKARHEVLIAVPGKKRRRRLTVLNELADFTRLITALKDYGRPVRAAFEATGNYHRALAYHLATAGFEVKLVSSVALARTREALHNSWDKNDPKDAQVILHMMEIGNEQFYHDPLVRGTNDIQELSKTHDIVSKSKTELWHRIEGSTSLYPGMTNANASSISAKIASAFAGGPMIGDRPLPNRTAANVGSNRMAVTHLGCTYPLIANRR